MKYPDPYSLANTFEFEDAAREKLPTELFKAISGSDRRPFDHITIRPRMMVDTRKLDLSLTLFGTKLLVPIIANSPADASARPDRFHPDGDNVLASSAVASRSIAITNYTQARPNASPWVRVINSIQAKHAIDTGAQVLFTSSEHFVQIHRSAPAHAIVAEHVLTAGGARRALDAGAAGLLVNKPTSQTKPHPMDALVPIADAAGKVPVLVDGGFRRGTDILMALALGARAVVLTRPVIWGLASYGPIGATAVLDLLQTELARNMAMAGKPTLAALSRDVLTIHKA
jgi:isopentenyl diphosphate isomerase/L-lactate dehydrogenase-like FMN-dependent dehydrogenase